ncbi:MAG: CDP-diacylglycerol--glycerol-3-phosphate 3-phosphatidyltransferase [Solobacterium sp.]|nr:CDP-diacylglycerol--glycerol-3-phosphate 3-phosphatidyltransferase [Solobacterium sp.]
MNLPNKLTLFRIVLVPVILLVWLFPYGTFGINIPSFPVGPVSLSVLNIVVLVLFLIASFTDMLDGKIARKRNLITTFGKFADPIADKLLVNSIFIVLASKGAIPVIPVVIMLSRDTIVDCCRMLASQNGVVVAAGMMGKVKTVLQMVTISLVLINNLPFELFYFPMTTIMIWLTAFVSFASGYSYFVQMKSYIFESM